MKMPVIRFPPGQNAVEKLMQHLVIGAGSAIAAAIIDQYLSAGDSIVAVSRSVQPDAMARADGRLEWLQSDYSEESIQGICNRLRESAMVFDRVFICNGILHHAHLVPEKRLEEVAAELLTEVMHINAFQPTIWVKHLKPVLRSQQHCILTAFSARIGSIGDNGRGGWYAYRASKAALNMLMKSAAIEYQRERRNVQFLLFHPGTTDTPLSKPFQRSVSPDKLFTAAYVASQLLSIIDGLDPEPSIQYLDWKNTAIEW
ncbi:MAG: short-chain dehydrogenase [Gammaproteobacteria bacterium]|nr:short-chain dehydrogenase [Gammaproteobacteria bacterium]